MKNILIPIDYTFNRYDAIDYAVQFLKNEDCNFYFINTYTYDVEGINAVDNLKADELWFGKPKQDSEMCLGKLIENYAFKNNKKHQFNAISECSSLLKGIKKAIETLQIDLVIVAGKEQTISSQKKYSNYTKNIIEHIRECPVMVIPTSAHLQEEPCFVIVSIFEKPIPKTELESWYKLVLIANGKMKIVSFCKKDQMHEQQKKYQCKARFHLEMLSGQKVEVEYIDTAPSLKDFAKYHSDYIISLIDCKPNLWRICGLTSSQITNLGPLHSTPLIALHR